MARGGGCVDVGAQSGEDEVDHVHHAVAIHIVVGKVHFGVGCRAGIYHELAGGPCAIGIVLAAVDLDGPYDVEGGQELSVGVVAIVVADTACAADTIVGDVGAAVAGVVIVVYHPLHDGGIVCVAEGTVVVLDEDDESAELGVVVACLASLAECACLLCSVEAAQLLGLCRGLWYETAHGLQIAALGC